MATEAPLPNATISQTYIDAHLDSTPTTPILEDKVSIPPPKPPSQRHLPPTATQPPRNPFLTTTTCTLHAFPSLEPTRFATYPSTHLLLPLRKDILHRAVIHEADATRQGTASTKTRYEVHGSNRKIRPQKGTGMARLGDKKSPMLRGGGVAFGPKPRSFETGLQGRVYDLAWRTAVSYRYRRGELVLLDGKAELPDTIDKSSWERYVREMLGWNRMGHADGRTLFVTRREREGLFRALEGDKMGRHARVLEVGDVDVKDLLELGRVVMEKRALEWILKEHERDLAPALKLGMWEKMMVQDAVHQQAASIQMRVS